MPAPVLRGSVASALRAPSPDPLKTALPLELFFFTENGSDQLTSQKLHAYRERDSLIIDHIEQSGDKVSEADIALHLPSAVGI